MNFSILFLGLKLYLWILLFTGIALGLGILAILKRHAIQAKIWKTFWPEKVIEVYVHNPGTPIYNMYIRLIPKSEELTISNALYRYDSRNLVKKDNEDFAIFDNNQWKIKVDGKEYKLKSNKFQIGKNKRWPEIHYYRDNSEPIDWTSYSQIKGEFNLPAQKLNDLIDSDIVTKALSFQQQNTMILLCLLFTILGIILSVVNILKSFGAIK